MRKALFIWELPQLMLGFLLYFKLRKSICRTFTYRHSRVFVSDKVGGAVSLSWLIFLEPRTDKLRFIQHEYGHSMQSLCLGWFYLPVVGLPSIIRSVVWKEKN
ncbi:MAG: hypothetical protein U5N58_01320 [Actinomycetota bacterium]|nr:hypothetical protein [Actinomycetota bacterium]